MAYEIRVRIDTNNAPTDAQTRYTNWKTSFDTVLESRETGYRTVEGRSDGTRPSYDEFRVLFDIREDRQTILDQLLTTTFPDASWLVVHARQSDAESSDDTYSTDPTYYNPELTDGLRAPPTITHDGKHDISYEDVHYLVNGNEVTAPAGTLSVTRPVGSRQDILYATDAGEVEVLEDATDAPAGTIRLATLSTHPGKIVAIETEQITRVDEDWGTPYTVRGSPPEPLVDDAVSWPEPTPISERISNLEKAAGVGGPGQKGIAGRLDEIENRLDDLETYHN